MQITFLKIIIINKILDKLGQSDHTQTSEDTKGLIFGIIIIWVAQQYIAHFNI